RLFAREGAMDRGDRARGARVVPEALGGLGLERLQKLPVEDPQNLHEIMTALEHMPARAQHRILALSVAQLRPLFDHEQRYLAGASEDRERRDIGEEIDRVIAPLAGGNHASINCQDSAQFRAIESHLLRLPAEGYDPRGLRACLRAEERYGFLDHRSD